VKAERTNFGHFGILIGPKFQTLLLSKFSHSLNWPLTYLPPASPCPDSWGGHRRSKSSVKYLLEPINQSFELLDLIGVNSSNYIPNLIRLTGNKNLIFVITGIGWI
jgi:hypothetical protein